MSEVFPPEQWESVSIPEDLKRSYTLIKDEATDRFLGWVLYQMRVTISRFPEAQGGKTSIVLGGGYGRGEGAVRKRENVSERLYNDLDFFVFSDWEPVACAALNQALHVLSHEWEAKLNIDIDFAPARKYSSLKRVGTTLMFQELAAGCCVVWGSNAFVQELPQPDFRSVALSEGARLLLNRGTGLLLSAQKLRGELKTGDGNFIARNINKALLGCGDAWLIARHKYHSSVVARREELSQQEADSPLAQALSQAYQNAVAFKASPLENVSKPDLQESHQKALSLYLAVFCDFFGVSWTQFEEQKEINGRTFQQKILSAKCWQGGDGKRNFAANLCALRMHLGWTWRWRVHPRNRILMNLFWLLVAIQADKHYSIKGVRFLSETQYLVLWGRFN